MDPITQQISQMVAASGKSIKSLLKMDKVFQDKVVYGANTPLTDYVLFDDTTSTGKDSQSRTDKFPLNRGKYYAFLGIRTSHNLILSQSSPGVRSTTDIFNQMLLEQESSLILKIDKTELNPIPFDLTLPYDTYLRGTTPTQSPKQNWSCHYFGDSIIMPDSGNVLATFKPRQGFSTVTTAVTNPVNITNTTGAENFWINVKIFAIEYTIIYE